MGTNPWCERTQAVSSRANPDRPPRDRCWREPSKPRFCRVSSSPVRRSRHARPRAARSHPRSACNASRNSRCWCWRRRSTLCTPILPRSGSATSHWSGCISTSSAPLHAAWGIYGTLIKSVFPRSRSAWGDCSVCCIGSIRFSKAKASAKRTIVLPWSCRRPASSTPLVYQWWPNFCSATGGTSSAGRGPRCRIWPTWSSMNCLHFSGCRQAPMTGLPPLPPAFVAFAALRKTRYWCAGRRAAVSAAPGARRPGRRRRHRD